MKKYPLIIFLLFISAIGCQNIQAKIWSTEFPHQNDYFSLNRNSQVVDADGNPHIFYGGSHLYHSYRNLNGNWTREVVDSSPRVGKYTVAKRDHLGNYHILYTDLHTTAPYSSNHKPVVKYAVGNTSNWVIEETPVPVDAFGRTSFGGAKSIDIDSSGRVHFAYMSVGGLYHATKESSSWNIEALNTSNFISSDPGDIMLAIGNNDEVMIAYFSQDTNHLMIAEYSGGTWNHDAVNTTIDPFNYGNFMALAVDSTNTTHVCYPAYTNGAKLFCSNNATGSWVHELVDDGTIDSTPGYGAAGYYPSIYIDDSDNIYLSYFIESSGMVEYIRYAKKENSNWNLATYHINPSPNLRQSNLVVMDNGSLGTFLTYDDPNHNSGREMSLDYLFWDGSTWSLDTVNTARGSAFTPGYNSDVVIDQNGFSHIVYAIETDVGSALYYANNQSVDWAVERLASFPSYYEYVKPAITLDENGNVHIATGRFDIEVGTYHISNTSGVWTHELVESEFIAVGDYTINIDSSGVVHIAYITNGTISRLQPWQVRYANNASGGWVGNEVYRYEDADIFDYSRSSFPNANATLAIDSSDNIQIAFIRGKRLIRALQTQTGWALKTILSTDDVPNYFLDFVHYVNWSFPSITFDKNMDIHFAYNAHECTLTCFPAGLRYAKYSSESWQHQLVDAELYYLDYPYFVFLTPYQPDIQVTDTGNVYISYYHSAYEHLRLAELKNDCLIQSVEVDSNLSMYQLSTRDYFLDSSLAIDNDGNIRIAYFDYSNRSLKQALSAPSLEVESCITNQVDDQTLNLDLSNVTSNPISFSDVTLLSNPGGAFNSNTCNQGLINPSSSCSISLHIEDSIAKTVPGVLHATITDSVNNKSNMLFFRLPELTRNSSDSGSSDGSSSGGGGALSLYMILLMSVSAFTNLFTKILGRPYIGRPSKNANGT